MSETVDPTEVSRAELLKVFGGDEARLAQFAELMIAEAINGLR